MNKIFSKQDFKQLDFDTKCSIIENLLSDDYYNGQTEINFYVPNNFKGEAGESLSETPPDIKKIEDAKFELLIDKLTDKLFANKKVLEFDLED